MGKGIPGFQGSEGFNTEKQTGLFQIKLFFMNIDQLNELMVAGDMHVAMGAFETSLIVKNLTEVLKQYHPKYHDVHDTAKRRDKPIKDDDGRETDSVKVSRLSLPIQKKIVLVAAAFLGNPVIDSAPSEKRDEDFVALIKKIWNDNKLDYRFKRLAKTTMAERHCAELWYTVKAEEKYWDGYQISSGFKLKMRLLANTLGDCLYPVFDSFGDMIAFGRKYEVIEIDRAGKETEVQHFDVYTADRIYLAKYEGNTWVMNQDESNDVIKYIGDGKPGIPNPIGKIPVIYYHQPIAEWEDVQECIDRLETLISNHADTNDYNGSPILFADGQIEGFAEKGEQGKLIQGKNGAKLSYVTWDLAPESIKMEIDNLLKFIHTFTHTPDISFENLKNLGYFSTIALKTIFLDAHMKAADKEETFGEGVQRRINYLKKAVSFLDSRYELSLLLEMKPSFEYFLPKNSQEMIETLTKAVDGGILSTETAIEQNPLVNNPEDEKGRIKDEKAAATPPAPVVPIGGAVPKPAEK
jgi:SPP1 family phage portal protein